MSIGGRFMLQSRHILVVCLAAFGSILAGAAAPDERQEPPPQITRGALSAWQGFIGLGNELYLERKLAAARQYGTNLVIVEIDSPGGRLDSSFNIAKRLRDAHWPTPWPIFLTRHIAERPSSPWAAMRS